MRPVLGPDGRLQPGRQVAQDHGGHEQQTPEDAGQRQERAAVVLRGHRATVVYVLGHDHRVLDVLLELCKVRRVQGLVRRVRGHGRQQRRAVGVHVPLTSAPVPGRLEQVQAVLLKPITRRRVIRFSRGRNCAKTKYTIKITEKKNNNSVMVKSYFSCERDDS